MSDKQSTLWEQLRQAAWQGLILRDRLLEIASRGSYALHDTRTPLLFALGGMGTHAVLSIILVRIGGAAGLALAMSLATSTELSTRGHAETRRL